MRTTAVIVAVAVEGLSYANHALYRGAVLKLDERGCNTFLIPNQLSRLQYLYLYPD